LIRVAVPGDKSIGHRSLMFAAIAEGESLIRGLPEGLDVRSTVSCLQALGVRIELGELCRVQGVGLRGLRAPDGALDCGNSGTTMRLLAGILAGSGISATLTGDDSLCGRPMRRVIDPLAAMGAQISHHNGGAPLTIFGAEAGAQLTGKIHQLPVASAQVKSAILLAGLSAEGQTQVLEPGPARDHTERMLAWMGAPLECESGRITISRTERLTPLSLTVPGDPSSAAFWLALGVFSQTPVQVAGLSLNRTRIGFIDLLRQAGARLEITDVSEMAGEPVGTVTAMPGLPERPLCASGSLVVRAIDELPLAMTLAALVPGRSVFRDAAELRVKECDRIRAVADNLRRLGVPVEESPDGLAISGGGPLQAAVLESHGDHRIAMSGGVLAALTPTPIQLRGAEASAVSYPTFFAELEEHFGVTPMAP